MLHPAIAKLTQEAFNHILIPPAATSTSKLSGLLQDNGVSFNLSFKVTDVDSNFKSVRPDSVHSNTSDLGNKGRS